MPDIQHKWSFTRLPPAVRILFKGMPGVWRHRHQLIFCWLIVMQIVTSGPRTLTGLSQTAPGFITEWRCRHLLSAGYWSLKVLLHWFAEEAIKSLPAPDDHGLYVICRRQQKRQTRPEKSGDPKGTSEPAPYLVFRDQIYRAHGGLAGLSHTRGFSCGSSQRPS